MPAPARIDPYRNFRFVVDIDGNRAGFTSVSGLAAEAEVIEYREGWDGLTSTRKLAGRVKYPNVTLRRGVTTDRFLWDWWKMILAGTVQRRNVGIILLDDDRNEVLRWSLNEAWIARIEVSDLDAEGNEVAIESIELAHEGLELE
jgi:phage tail-like protein